MPTVADQNSSSPKKNDARNQTMRGSFPDSIERREAARLLALRRYGSADTIPDPAFRIIAALAKDTLVTAITAATVWRIETNAARWNWLL